MVQKYQCIDSDLLNKNIGEVLYRFRKLKKISGEKLGFTLEISQQQVSRYELGKGNLTVSLLFRILTALDISLIVFLNELRKQYDSSDTVHTLLDIDNLLFLNKNINMIYHYDITVLTILIYHSKIHSSIRITNKISQDYPSGYTKTGRIMLNKICDAYY